MSHLRGARTTTTEQDAFWRKWVTKGRRLSGELKELSWSSSMSEGEEQQRVTTQGARNMHLTPLEEIHARGVAVRTKNDPYVLGQSPVASPKNEGSLRRGSVSVKDASGYRRLPGGEASGGLHMYQKASMYDTLHHLPHNTSGDDTGSWKSQSVRVNSPTSTQAALERPFLLYPPAREMMMDTDKPRRIIHVPRLSSPEPSHGINAISSGTTQLGFRTAGRIASFAPLRPPSPPRGEAPARYLTTGAQLGELSNVVDMSIQSSPSSRKSTQRLNNSTVRAQSSLGRNEHFDETLWRGKAYPVRWHGAPVMINSSSVVSRGRPKTRSNWGMVATSGLVVDLCMGEEHILREKLSAMQEVEG